MYSYKGQIRKLENGKYLALVLLVNTNEPNYDTVMEREASDEVEASMWLDDNISKLTTGKGIWDR